MISVWLQLIPFASGLSPYERFEAMRQLDTNQQSGLYDLLTNKWFILMGWSVIVVLMLVLAAIHQQRKEKEKLHFFQLFEEKRNLFGLTEAERDILYRIAKYARLKRFHLIYFRPQDFEAGMTHFFQKHVFSHPDEAFRRQQVKVIESIKYKVGFVKKDAAYVGRYRRGRDLTSRQVPVGAEVTVVVGQSQIESRHKAEVTANEVTGLTLQSQGSLPFQPGEICVFHYMIGSVIWGFDVTVLNCEGEKIEVCHADHARYINRRRFVKIPLRQSALITPFPVLHESTEPKIPSFAEAGIIDISGSVLRIHSPLEMIRKDRLLVIFKVESGRVVQDIAEVRRVGQADSGPYYLIELIGLDGRSEDELIRITNRVAFEQGLVQNEECEVESDEVETMTEVNA